MKKLLLVTACICLAQLTHAQGFEKDPYFGVKLGANFSSLHYNPGLVQTDVNPKFGLAGGFTYTYPISKALSFQPEILYSQMGAKFVNKNVGVTLDKGTLNTHYISVPLQLKIHAGEHFAFTVGPQADFFIDSRMKYDHAGQVSPGYFTGFDLLGTVGLELGITRNLALYGRYMHGFKNINYNLKSYDGSPITSKAYNRGIQVGLAFYFRHKPEPVVVAPPPPPPVPDTDGDGILDNVDKCPTVAGIAKYQGCPIPDTDKDGINDEQDKCPTTPGLAKYAGCPIPDTDNDGVNDEQDKCPTVAGLAKYAGCPPPDRDGDGVIDEEDKCPDVAGPASNGGCPALESTKFNASMVQFNTGTATLTPSAQKGLNEAAVLLNDPKYAPLKVSIEGHTDNVGKAASNQKLSEKRAASVKAYLVKKGVNADRLSTSGFGDTAPIADNKTKAGKASNRRVEFKVSQ